jgi:dipeptidyl aminopeptidase/acylaminoacyl peptidase
MAIAPGTRFGPYEILALIGAGGMGEVYRARDPRLTREVAIKVLPATFSSDAERLRRFEQEARAAGVLNHPNITAVHDLGTYEGSPYVVQELLEGETLRSVLASGHLSPRKATDYAIQIVRGLAAAHEKGIVHRDLKPENVFVINDGRVKILDFGLAKLTSDEGTGSQTNLPTKTAGTEAGVVLGTLGYMSPEQVRGKPADARSDIFSFGAILYEMLSGKRAFHGDSAADTMSAILKEDPPEISLTNQNVPAGLDRIVRHCLEKNPEQRFRSAHDLAFDLESLSDVSAPARPLTAPAESSERRRWAAPALAILALAAVAGAYVLGVRKGAGAAPPEPAFMQLTFRQQPIFNARFAADGKTIVYSAAPSGNATELFTVRPDFPGGVSRGLKNVHLLSISSKGELAVLTKARFLIHSVFSGTLARMPLEGAAPREIRDDVREADWNPEGTELALIRDVGGKDQLEYPPGKVLATTGGYFSNPRFSRRGDAIAFFDHPSRFDDRGGVAMVDLSGKKKALSDGYWGLEGLTWSPSGEEVLYSGGTAYNNFRVYAVDRSGRRRVALQSAGGLTVHDTRPDGKWIVTRDDFLRSMPVSLRGWPAERDLSWLDLSQPIAFSADNRTLVFTEESGILGANYSACIRSTEGSDVVRLGEGFGQDISPDGKWVLSNVPVSPMLLVLYPMGAGEPRRLDTGTVMSHELAQFFPDGRHILVTGSEPGRATRCWVQDIERGRPAPETPEGTTDCYPSTDGKRILARKPEGLWIYPVGGGSPVPVAGTQSTDRVIRWGRDGKSALVITVGEVPARIERLDLSSGKREPFRTVGPPDLTGVTGILPVVVSPDETAHAYTTRRMISNLFQVDGAR